MFMNPDYVSRQFLQQTGYRFVDYLLALRIRKAQWLLVNGVPPQQVPERVGYSANPQYFVHLFSKATGMTPREYAQALRIEP
ncbi:MAG: helix-turn-helix transcriptional regulator [Ruthenibacterium lactatiformans]